MYSEAQERRSQVSIDKFEQQQLEFSRRLNEGHSGVPPFNIGGIQGHLGSVRGSSGGLPTVSGSVQRVFGSAQAGSGSAQRVSGRASVVSRSVQGVSGSVSGSVQEVSEPLATPLEGLSGSHFGIWFTEGGWVWVVEAVCMLAAVVFDFYPGFVLGAFLVPVVFLVFVWLVGVLLMWFAVIILGFFVLHLVTSEEPLSKFKKDR